MKEFLSRKGVDFTERDISRDRVAAQELIKLTGRMAVPVTVVGSEAIIGFDRERLETVIDRLQPQPEAPRPSFGAAVADAGRITARQSAGIVLGAYVGNIHPGSLAERIGLAKGDIITEINRQGIANAADMEAAFSRLDKGSFVTVVFQRGDRKLKGEGTF